MANFLVLEMCNLLATSIGAELPGMSGGSGKLGLRCNGVKPGSRVGNAIESKALVPPVIKCSGIRQPEVIHGF